MDTTDINTKQKLIHAAKKLFAKYNFDYASTRMIAKEAGVGQSAIFFHFGSKENLAKAVIEDIITYCDSYYHSIYHKTTEAYREGTITPAYALGLLMEYISIEMEIASNPDNSFALSYMINANTLPPDIFKPLNEVNKTQVELPMARLLCTYKGSDRLANAFMITHSIITSIIAYRMSYSPETYGAGFGYEAIDENKGFLLDYYRTSLENLAL